MKPPVSPEFIVQFKLNPDALIARNTDSRTIEATTRDLVGSDAVLATDMISLARKATPQFRSAIAAGLAQAALACSGADQVAAQSIQQAVAGFEDGDFQSVFAAVAGDLSTAATDAAGMSASSSAGSVAVVNANRAAPATTARGGGGVISALSLSTSGASLAAGRSTLSTIAASPVSPTR